MRIIVINQLNYFSTLYGSHATFFGSNSSPHHQADTTPNKNYYVNRIMLFYSSIYLASRSQWPRGLRRRSSAALLLRLWVRIPPGAWMFVCCECCVLSGRGLYDGLITRPGESYRLSRVVVCDQETSKTRRLKPATGL